MLREYLKLSYQAFLLQPFRENLLEVESFFYRTRSGMEVDLLLSSAHGVIALEARSRPDWAPSDLRGMKALADALGPRFRGGLVVTAGGALEPASSDGRFWCVPAHRLFS